MNIFDPDDFNDIYSLEYLQSFMPKHHFSMNLCTW